MKKTSKTKKRSKKSATTKRAARKSTKTASGTDKQPLLAKQPASKQQAAIDHGVFLHTDDSWSNPYFDEKDLHFLERELFG